MHSFDLAKLEPYCHLVARAPGVVARVLSDPRTAHAIYLQGRSPTELMLNLEQGQWTAEWISVENGSVLKHEAIAAEDGKPTGLASPAFSDAVALRVVRLSRAHRPDHRQLR